MAIYWFIFCLFLIFVEITTVNLVSIWFAIGALLAMITALFTDSLLIQVVVFAVISMIALLATKPIVKKMKVVQGTFQLIFFYSSGNYQYSNRKGTDCSNGRNTRNAAKIR